MSQQIKRWVSKNKRRYMDDGFDLDLTYICPNLLAMGFPAEKVEGLYRNNIDDVVRFLETKHPDNYKVYNLCSERVYDTKKFHDRVASYPFDDHSPPKFELIRPFCEDVDQWLGHNKNNIAAIHCKAGKGRTGVMICCYLLHRGRFAAPADVLNFYGLARTNNSKGVTIPSQQRYVGYYSDLVRFKLQYRPVTLLLHTIELDTLTLQTPVVLSVHQLKVKLHQTLPVATKQRQVVFDMNQPLPICGDIKIEVTTKQVMRKEKVFHFWFNTFFLQFGNTLKRTEPADASQSSVCACITTDEEREMNGSDAQTYYQCAHYPEKVNMVIASFNKCELDGCNKDEANRFFSPDFRVKLVMSRVSSPSAAERLKHRQHMKRASLTYSMSNLSTTTSSSNGGTPRSSHVNSSTSQSSEPDDEDDAATAASATGSPDEDAEEDEKDWAHQSSTTASR